mgnify:FL=1
MTQYAPAIEICCCQNCDAEGHPKETIRELTTEEIAQRETDAANHANMVAEQEAKEAARISARAKLAAIAGLTEDEINAL